MQEMGKDRVNGNEYRLKLVLPQCPRCFGTSMSATFYAGSQGLHGPQRSIGLAVVLIFISLID